MKENTKTLFIRERNQKIIKNIIICALFCAMAIAVEYLTIHVHLQFLTFDLKDAILTFCGLVLGPLWTIPSVIVTCLIEFMIEPETGIWGLFMNLLSSLSFALVVSIVYSIKKNYISLIIGLISAIITTSVIMIVANIFITPLYMNAKRSDVIALIPKLLLPFNLLKGLANSGVILLLYTPIMGALTRAKIIKSENQKLEKRTMIIFILTGIVVSVIAFAIVCFVLGGEFGFSFLHDEH